MKGKNILKGRATGDEVIVYFDDPSMNAFEANLDRETGQITARRTAGSIGEWSQINYCVDEYLLNKWQIITSLIIFAIGLIYFFINKNPDIFLAVIYFIIFVWFNIFWALSICKRKHVEGSDEEAQAKMHAALHKVLNAYNQTGHIPTVEEAKTYSLISKECKSNSFFTKTFLFGGLTFNLATVNSTILILAFIFVGLMGLKFPIFRFMQKLILSEPDDIEISTAIEAVKCFEAYRIYHPEL